MGDLTREQRLQIMLTEEELAVIDDWRFARRMPTRAAAVRDVKNGGGLNVEALDVSPDQKELLLGFRGPLIDGKAIVARVGSLPNLFEGGEPDVRQDRIVEHRGRVMPFEQQRVVEERRARRQHGDGDRGDQNLRGVKFDRAAAEPQHQISGRLRRPIRRADQKP